MRYIIAVLAIVFLLGCAHYQTSFNPDKIQTAIDNMVIIETVAEIEGYDEPEKHQAIGFLHPDGYIVGLKHAIKAKDIIEIRSGYFMVMMPRNILSEKYYIGEKEIELIGIYDDIALFKGEEKGTIPFGDSDKLQIGTQVIMLGCPGMTEIAVRYGIVSRVDVDNNAYSDFIELEGESFIISCLIASGDSGGIVLANRNGKPEILGISHTYFMGVGGVIFKSNYVQEAISEILITYFNIVEAI